MRKTFAYLCVTIYDENYFTVTGHLWLSSVGPSSFWLIERTEIEIAEVGLTSALTDVGILRSCLGNKIGNI